MRGSRVGGMRVRTPPPPLKSQNIGFLGNAGPDPLKNQNATKPTFNVGAFRLRAAGGPMMAHFKGYLDHLISHQKGKKVVNVGPPLRKLSGSEHGFCAYSISIKISCTLMSF